MVFDIHFAQGRNWVFTLIKYDDTLDTKVRQILYYDVTDETSDIHLINQVLAQSSTQEMRQFIRWVLCWHAITRSSGSIWRWSCQSEKSYCGETMVMMFSNHHFYDKTLDSYWNDPRVPFYQCGLTLILAWISNNIHYKMWDEITYPFLNFNVTTVEV